VPIRQFDRISIYKPFVFVIETPTGESDDTAV